MMEDVRSESEQPASNAQWLAEPERGSRFGMQALLFCLRLFGRRPVHFLMFSFLPYFAFRSSTASRAVRDFWHRFDGRSVGYFQVLQHLYRFAQVTLDRVLLTSGNLKALNFERTGTEHLRSLLAQKKGALLLGAHLGSFEAMRAIALKSDFPVTVLAHQANAKKIAAFLESVSNGRTMVRVLEIEPGNPAFILKAKERIEAGELVAVLGDRIGIGERSTRAEFLGAAASFPSGPYLLASLLGCPVYLVFGLFSSPSTYRLFCEPFAERVELPRRGREEALEAYVRRFAERLEYYCRKAPDNWFNFFDFWNDKNV